MNNSKEIRKCIAQLYTYKTKLYDLNNDKYVFIVSQQKPSFLEKRRMIQGLTNKIEELELTLMLLK